MDFGLFRKYSGLVGILLRHAKRVKMRTSDRRFAVDPYSEVSVTMRWSTLGRVNSMQAIKSGV